MSNSQNSQLFYYDGINTTTNSSSTYLDDDGCYKIVQSVYVQPYLFIAIGIFKGLLLVFLTNRFSVLIVQCVKSRIVYSHHIPVIDTTSSAVIDEMNTDAVEFLKLMQVQPSPAAVFAVNCALVNLKRKLRGSTLEDDPILRGIPLECDISVGAFNALANKDEVQYALHDPDVALVFSVVYKVLNENLFAITTSSSTDKKEEESDPDGKTDSQRLLTASPQHPTSKNDTSKFVHGSRAVIGSDIVMYDARAFGSLVPQWWMQLLSALSIVFLFVSFVAAAIKDSHTSEITRGHEDSSWIVYEGIYARVANSGLVAIAVTNIATNTILKFTQKYFGGLAHYKFVQAKQQSEATAKSDYSSDVGTTDDNDDHNNDEAISKNKKVNGGTNRRVPVVSSSTKLTLNEYEKTLKMLRETLDPLRARDPLLGHELSKVQSRALQYLLLLLVPGLLTHSIPMLFVYLWVPLIFILILLLVLVIIISRGREIGRRVQDAFNSGLAVSLVAFVVSISVSLFLELTFNWAVLFYKRSDYDLSYVGVLSKDFESRNIKCWTVHQVSTIQGDVVSFSNWLQLLSAAFP